MLAIWVYSIGDARDEYAPAWIDTAFPGVVSLTSKVRRARTPRQRLRQFEPSWLRSGQTTSLPASRPAAKLPPALAKVGREGMLMQRQEAAGGRKFRAIDQASERQTANEKTREQKLRAIYADWTRGSLLADPANGLHLAALGSRADSWRRGDKRSPAAPDLGRPSICGEDVLFCATKRCTMRPRRSAETAWHRLTRSCQTTIEIAQTRCRQILRPNRRSLRSSSHAEPGHRERGVGYRGIGHGAFAGPATAHAILSPSSPDATRSRGVDGSPDL